MNTIKILDSNVSIIIYVYNIYLDVFSSSSVSTKQFFNLVRYQKIALDFFKEAKEESMRKRGKKKSHSACLFGVHIQIFLLCLCLTFFSRKIYADFFVSSYQNFLKKFLGRSRASLFTVILTILSILI